MLFNKACCTWLGCVSTCNCVHNKRSSIWAGWENENAGRSSKLNWIVLLPSVRGNSGCDKQTFLKLSYSVDVWFKWLRASTSSPINYGYLIHNNILRGKCNIYQDFP